MDIQGWAEKKCYTFFGVIPVLDNSEKFLKLYWLTPKIFQSYPIPLQIFFGVIQYNSEQHFN